MKQQTKEWGGNTSYSPRYLIPFQNVDGS